MSKSIGAIEFRSISKGIEVSNEMVKKSLVEVLYLKSICPGKFLIIICGDVSEVNESIKYGLDLSKNYMVDNFVINHISPEIIEGLRKKYNPIKESDAIGVVETNKVCAGIKMLDKTLKSSNMNLAKLQLSFTIGGKLVYIVSGDLSSIEYGINTAKETINSNNIINISIIPNVDKQIIKNL